MSNISHEEKEMVRRLMTALMVSALLIPMMAIPAWSKSDRMVGYNEQQKLNNFSFRQVGVQALADDDSPAGLESDQNLQLSNLRRSLGSTRSTSEIAGDGITVDRTWEDWQWTVGRHRVEWNVTPNISFIYTDQFTSGQTPRFGYNIYSPLGGGSWPQGLEVGCEAQASDATGQWPTLDVNGKGHIVMGGFDDISNDNHMYYQTSDFSCFFGGGTFINQSQYKTGFADTILSTLAHPAVEYQEWAGDTVVHLLAQESAAADLGHGFNELVIQYFRKDGTGATGSWIGPVTIDSIAQRAQSGGYIASSKVSPKVAISYVHASALAYSLGAHGTGGPGDGGTCWTDNEIFYRESDSLGVVWGPPINATQYNRTQLSNAPSGNPRHDANTFYDSEGFLHIVYNGRGIPADVYSSPGVDTFFFCDFSNSIYHWSERTSTVSRMSNADYGIFWNSQHCGFGGNGLGYGGMMSIGECDGNLYVVWSQVHDIFGIENGGVPQFDDCSTIQSNRNRRDIANHEIWMSISSSLDGLLWDLQRNITQTYTPGCDSATSLGGVGTCMSETRASLSRYGMDDAAMTASFGALTWPSATLLDPSGSYAGDHFLQLFYLEDHLPGSSNDPSNTGAVAIEGSLKWARLACIDPITAPQIAIDPRGIGYPQQVDHGSQFVITITVTNDGNTGLNVSSIGTAETSGPSGWLGASESSLSIPAGASNTSTFDITINQGGIVNSNGTIVALNGEVYLLSDAPAPFDSVTYSIVNFIVGDVAALTRDTISTGTISLSMSNNGNMGDGGEGSVNLDYTASGSASPDCDATATVYMFDGSPLIIQKIDSATFNLSTNLFTGGFGPSYAFKPLADQTLAGSFTGPGGSDAYNTSTFTNWDSSIAVEQTYYAPTSGTPDDNFIMVKTMFFSNDGMSHSNLMLGDLIDWDTPSDDGATNTAGILTGTSKNIVYLRGVDTASVAGCQLFSTRFSASAFMGMYSSTEFAGDTCANDRNPWGVYADINGSTNPAAAGSPNGAIDSAIAWSETGALTGQWAISSDTLDQRITQTYVWDYTLGATDTLTVYNALITIKNGTEADLDASVEAAIDWYAANLRGGCNVRSCCMGTVGNIDNDGGVDIADLTFLIDHLFINFPQLDCPEEGNVDADGGIDIADLTFLIDHLFINFPVLPDCP